MVKWLVFFQCSRGVKQGDPLSSLLLILAEEVLNRALHHMFSQGKIQGISSPHHSFPLSHVNVQNN